MKIILLSTIVGLTLPLYANEAKLVTISTGSKPLEELESVVRPMAYKFGTELTFSIEAENFISIDKKSLVAGGWEIGNYVRICTNRKQATFSIIKEGNFMDKIDDLKVAGTIVLSTAKKTKTVTAAVTAKGEQKLGPFTVRFKIKAGGEVHENGVILNGDLVKDGFDNIKRVTVTQGGKELHSWGVGIDGIHKEFYFTGIKEGDQVSIEYWSDLKKVTYKFSK